MIEKENPDILIGEEIENSIIKYAEHKHGLGIIECPTGSGKSYNCCKAISRLFFEKIINKKDTSINKIIYLAPEKKHLPINELKKIMQPYYFKYNHIDPKKKTSKDEKAYEDFFKKEIFIYKSTIDYFLDFIKFIESQKGEIGEEYKSDINKIYQDVNSNKKKKIDFYKEMKEIYDNYMNIQKKEGEKNFGLKPEIRKRILEDAIQDIYKEHTKLMEIFKKKLDKDTAKDIKRIKEKYIDIIKDKDKDKEESKKEIEKYEKEIENFKRNYIINSVDETKIIGIYYPRCITKAHIIFMSLAKYMTIDQPLIGNKKKFEDDEWTKNSKIIMDEFDECKSVMWNQILDKKSMLEYDLIETEEEFAKSTKAECKSVNTMEAICNNPQKLTDREKIMERVNHKLQKYSKQFNRIREKYRLEYCYKTKENQIDTDKTVILNDGAYYTLSDNSLGDVTYCLKNEEKNNITVYHIPLNEYKKGNIENGYPLYNAITDIEKCIKNYSYMIVSAGKRYTAVRNTKILKSEDSTINLMTDDNGINTIIDALKIDPKYRNIIKLKGEPEFINQSTQAKYEPGYINRIKIIFLEDNINHNENTKIKSEEVKKIPELILLNMAQKSIVIGISATAKSKALNNFYLQYLKKSLGKEYYYEEIDKDKIRKAEEEITKPYKDKIKLELEIIKEQPTLNNQKKLNQIQYNEALEKMNEIKENYNIKNIFNLANQLLKIKMDKKKNNYNKYQDYCQILTMFDFCMSDMQTLLCFTKKMPEKGTIYTEGLKEIEKIMQDTKKTKGKIKLHDLNSENYEKEKDEIIKEAEEGTEKIIIRTSYKTAGRGINLTYRPPRQFKKNIVQLNPEYADDGVKRKDKRYLTKDIDAIYLAPLTHNYPLINSENEMEREKELIYAIIAVEELSNMDYISEEIKSTLLKDYYEIYKGNSKIDLHNMMKNYIPIRENLDIDLIQAAGRLERTYLKNCHQKIYISQYNLNIMLCDELKQHILGPIMTKIVNYQTKKIEEEETYVNVETTKQDRENNKCERIAKESYEKFRNNFTKAYAENTDENNESQHKEARSIYEIQRKLALLYPTEEPETLRKIQDEEFRRKGVNPNAENITAITKGWITRTMPLNMYKNKGTETRPRLAFEPIKGGKEISVDASGMQELLKINGIKEWFQKNHVPLTWEKKHCIITPKMFDLYKGILGELAFVYIAAKLSYTIEELPDDEFEIFDWKITNKYIYIDIKNWTEAISNQKEKAYIDKLKRKQEYLDTQHKRLLPLTNEEIKKNEELGRNIKIQKGYKTNEKFEVNENIPASKVVLINVYGAKSEDAKFQPKNENILIIGRFFDENGEIKLSGEEIKNFRKFMQGQNVQEENENILNNKDVLKNLKPIF